MNEKSLTVLEQYEINLKEIFRTKGNYGCVTEKDIYILQEYNDGEKKGGTHNLIGTYLEKNGLCCDYPIPNKEGKYVSVSIDGYTYILKKWFNARECDISLKTDIMKSVSKLGKFHSITENTYDLWNDEYGLHNIDNIINVYERHNREIIKVRNYINKRKNKSKFELDLQVEIGKYYRQGEQGIWELKNSSYEQLYKEAIANKSVCHGVFNHHSVLFEDGKTIVINMKKFGYGLQLYHFYGYLRKIMEKNEWDEELAWEVMDTYSLQVNLTKEKIRVLWSFFVYPEKFWKIINYYFNSNKAWSSDKNQEKLKQFQFQEEKRQQFIAQLKKKWE